MKNELSDRLVARQGGMKNSIADMAMLGRLWDATSRELSRYSETYAARHEAGVRETEGQKDIISTAKARGYLKGVVRALARAIRLSQPQDGILNAYREKLGL